MLAWPSIQINKASNTTGLRGAGVCQSAGTTLGLSLQHNLMSTGASHNDREQALSSPISDNAWGRAKRSAQRWQRSAHSTSTSRLLGGSPENKLVGTFESAMRWLKNCRRICSRFLKS